MCCAGHGEHLETKDTGQGDQTKKLLKLDKNPIKIQMLTIAKVYDHKNNQTNEVYWDAEDDSGFRFLFSTGALPEIAGEDS